MTGSVVGFTAATGTLADANTITETRAITAGNVVYVVLTFDIVSAQTLSSVSDNIAAGNYTLGAQSARDTTNNQTLCHAYYPGRHPGGTITVTANLSALSGARSLTIFELTGVSGLIAGQNAQFQTAPAAGADVVSSNAFTPTSQPGLLMAVSGNTASAAVPAVGTGFASVGTMMDMGLGAGVFFRGESKSISATSSIAGTFARTAAGGHCSVAMMFLDHASPIQSAVWQQQRNSGLYTQ